MFAVVLAPVNMRTLLFDKEFNPSHQSRFATPELAINQYRDRRSDLTIHDGLGNNIGILVKIKEKLLLTLYRCIPGNHCQYRPL